MQVTEEANTMPESNTNTGTTVTQNDLVQSISEIANRFMDALAALSQPIFMIALVLASIVFIINIISGQGLVKALQMFGMIIVGAFILSHLHDVYYFLSSIIFGSNPN